MSNLTHVQAIETIVVACTAWIYPACTMAEGAKELAAMKMFFPGAAENYILPASDAFPGDNGNTVHQATKSTSEETEGQ